MSIVPNSAYVLSVLLIFWFKTSTVGITLVGVKLASKKGTLSLGNTQPYDVIAYEKA